MQNAGIYARLSVKHGSRKDDSIENQILLARKWLQERRAAGEDIAEWKCYTDQGYTGTDFERPAFRQMEEDARKGNLQCIICKDASRFGRNYLEVGEYMEKVFPLLGVRVVCISEGYDSASCMPGGLGRNLRNLMNEWYARDISRKVLMVKAQKKRAGEYLGSVPPYGYRICYQDGKRVLAEEPETQEILEMMSRWQQAGMSIRQIREKLWEMEICPPGQYRRTGRVVLDGTETGREGTEMASGGTGTGWDGTKTDRGRTGPAPGETQTGRNGRNGGSGETDKEQTECLEHWNPSTIRHVLLSYTRGDYHTAQHDLS